MRDEQKRVGSDFNPDADQIDRQGAGSLNQLENRLRDDVVVPDDVDNFRDVALMQERTITPLRIERFLERISELASPAKGQPLIRPTGNS